MKLYLLALPFLGVSIICLGAVKSEVRGSIPKTPKLKEAASKQTGTATATPFHTNGKLWKATVTIGGQDLQLIIDTGSSDTWVYRPSCQRI